MAVARPGPSSSATLPAWASAKAAARSSASSSRRSTPAAPSPSTSGSRSQATSAGSAAVGSVLMPRRYDTAPQRRRRGSRATWGTLAPLSHPHVVRAPTEVRVASPHVPWASLSAARSPRLARPYARLRAGVNRPFVQFPALWEDRAVTGSLHRLTIREQTPADVPALVAHVLEGMRGYASFMPAGWEAPAAEQE